MSNTLSQTIEALTEAVEKLAHQASVNDSVGLEYVMKDHTAALNRYCDLMEGLVRGPHVYPTA